ncbi:restriction endonuclease subunit R [Candidatus Poribacteria bacterium]|nr:restriction endonuclease subunit R [Candidatus Poribacteria bacterium]
MARVFLQDMVDDIRWDALPINWTLFDVASFSRAKQLWDYQQQALENAIKVLWKYYEDFADYQPGERLEINQERKRRFFDWYRDNGQDENLDIGLNRANRNISRLLTEYYASPPLPSPHLTHKEEGAGVRWGEVSYQHFINRACFWMATGSGKTLVIVKLIQLLRNLIQVGEIPPHDILVLTHRDDLIDQLKAHVNEFNTAHRNIFIKLRELKEYAEVKRGNPSLFKPEVMATSATLTVFYYRSDNLSDEQKEKIIDFRNYNDNGKWYILLDEAHKGDKEDSKRQHIYSILSRNGFLFNFSATFTDPRDLITTVCNFNLSEFIKAGYGKHIAILKQEIRAFRNNEDYNSEEKQKVVLKSLIMLSYVRKCYEDIQNVPSSGGVGVGKLYHKPLLLTLVNSVNTEDADLKLFFREIERIGKGEINDDVWKAAKDELWEELKARPGFTFEENGRIEVDTEGFKHLSREDIRQYVFNAPSFGEIEISFRPSDKKQVAFKLTTTDKHFALMKTGDMPNWLKEELARFNVNHQFEQEGFFERLNEDDSDINILMGSRAFYEGWDSNRPNVINFINIGTGTDAKKFILQSVGRGVRIEPFKNKRKRLLPLYNAKEVSADLFHQIKDKVLPVESLFLFGTNRNALQTVIEQLNQEKEKEGEQQLSLFVNEEAKQHKLLIPTYRQADRPPYPPVDGGERGGVDERKLTKFEITSNELDLLKRYVEFVQDNRVLLALYETAPRKIEILRASLNDPDNYYKQDGRNFKNIDLLAQRIFDYFSIVPEEFERLKQLEEEIRHFKRITVSLKDISDLTQKVETVRQYQAPSALEAELKEKFTRGEITLEEYTESIKQTARMVREEKAEYQGKRFRIKHIANHYYVPIILSDEKQKIDYIKHIIQTPSEIDFINHLEQYLQGGDNKFKDFDWWLFSKLDESLDEVYIPYYSSKINKVSKFKPDFIFWLQRNKDYSILFIDPKGIAYTDYEQKIDGYRGIFEVDDAGKRVFEYNGLNVQVFAFLYTDDVNKLSKQYKEYWFDNMEKALNQACFRK